MKDTLIRRRVYGNKKSKGDNYRLKYFTITTGDEPVWITGFLGTTWYSINDGVTWTEVPEGGYANIPALTDSLWKGKLVPYVLFGYGECGIGTIHVCDALHNDTDSPIEVSGNAYSLSYGDDFEAVTSSTLFCNRCQFYALFWDCIALREAENLWLNSSDSFMVVASDWCCYCMFYNCSNLHTAPAYLPICTYDENATDAFLAMFYNCQSLVTPPKTVNIFCGYTNIMLNMFASCIGLKKTPIINILVHGDGIYSGMMNGAFYSCEALHEVTCYFSPALGAPPSSLDINPNWMDKWLYNVQNLGTFITNTDMNWKQSGDSGIPSGWTVIHL